MKSVTVYFAALALGLALVACDEDPEGTALTQQSAISECGGFADPGNGLPVQDPTTYCDAELLHWAYGSGSLALANTRISLNCCGEHGMSVELVDGVYVVHERDEPGPGGYRCRCMCAFDYTLEANGIPEGVISMRLEREVTDSGAGTELIWEGELDLAEGSGTITIDSSPLEFGCYDL
ncbi:MAG: hypothetical protein RBU30_01890 [Polyangia bacterium]|jgi:hypothetical protein|nr:hypothetical protein [Polyangia bacterium]